MKKILITAIAVATLFPNLRAQQLMDAPRGSQYSKVVQRIGLTDVTIEYSSPRVNDRDGKIWGALVPYGAPWRAGANENTVITFSDDVKVEGKDLNAGTYDCI